MFGSILCVYVPGILIRSHSRTVLNPGPCWTDNSIRINLLLNATFFLIIWFVCDKIKQGTVFWNAICAAMCNNSMKSLEDILLEQIEQWVISLVISVLLAWNILYFNYIASKFWYTCTIRSSESAVFVKMGSGSWSLHLKDPGDIKRLHGQAFESSFVEVGA